MNRDKARVGFYPNFEKMRRNKQGSLSKCIVIWKASTFTLTGFLVGVTTVLSAGATTVLAQQGHGQGNSFGKKIPE